MYAMKFLFPILIVLTLPVRAQTGPVVTRLALNEVPAAVASSFGKDFPGVQVIQWEKHTQRSYTKLVAIFDQDGIRRRARYQPDGTGISASSYYLFNRLQQLPEAIQKFARDRHPDYRLGSGERIVSLRSGDSIYRIRLRKGASLLVVYLNESGVEMDKTKLARELTDDEIDN